MSPEDKINRRRALNQMAARALDRADGDPTRAILFVADVYQSWSLAMGSNVSRYGRDIRATLTRALVRMRESGRVPDEVSVYRNAATKGFSRTPPYVTTDRTPPLTVNARPEVDAYIMLQRALREYSEYEAFAREEEIEQEPAPPTFVPRAKDEPPVRKVLRKKRKK